MRCSSTRLYLNKAPALLQPETNRRYCSKKEDVTTFNIFKSTRIDKANEYCSRFHAPVTDMDLLRGLVKSVKEQIKTGLDAQNVGSISVRVKSTYIQRLTTGNEKGDFLSISIGDQRIRLMKSYIYNGWIKKIKKDIPIDDFQRKEYTPMMVLALIAENCLHFIKEERITLGVPAVITYDLPGWIQQTSLTSGYMQYWAHGVPILKSFQYEINQVLTDFIAKFGLKMDIRGITTSLVASYVDSQWNRPDCIGALGLGREEVTVCHVERTSEVKNFDIDKNEPVVLMASEFKGFGELGELAAIIQPEDKALDAVSPDPGKRTFLKMTAGEHLGELVRLILVRHIKENLLFDGQMTENIQKPYVISNKDITTLENWEKNQTRVGQIMTEKLGYHTYNVGDLTILKTSVSAVTDRATRLVAVALAAIAERAALQNENKDNTLQLTFSSKMPLHYEQGTFERSIDGYVTKITDESVKVAKIMRSSGNAPMRGAALIAARYSQPSENNDSPSDASFSNFIKQQGITF